MCRTARPKRAGKTTLVRNVIGLIEGNADLIEVAGGNPRSAETRRRLGVVQQAVGFPRSLTVEIVGGAAARRGCPRRQPAKPLPRWVWPVWRSVEPRSSPADSSSGCSWRWGSLPIRFCWFWTNPPKVSMWKHGAGSGTRFGGVSTTEPVLITTHLVDEAATVADRVVMVDRGRVVAKGRQTSCVGRCRPSDRSPDEGTGECDQSARLGALGGRDGRTVIATTDSEQVVKTLLDLDPEANDLTVATASLEEVLVAMTHHEEVSMNTRIFRIEVRDGSWRSSGSPPLLFSVLMPVAFFALFATMFGGDGGFGVESLARYGAFGVLAVILINPGIGLADAREQAGCA